MTEGSGPGLSRDGLKLIAMAAMMLDHAAVFFMADGSAAYEVLRGIGRISYPLFAMLFAEGCRAGRTPFRTRLLWLCAAGAASEPFFDFMRSGSFLDPSGQCVMWSWALALIYLKASDAVSDACGGDRAAAFFAVLGLSCAFCWASEALRVDYGLLHGLCLSAWRAIAGRRPRGRRVLAAGCAVAGICALATPAALAAVLPMLAYRRERRGRFRMPKAAGYAFYPLHLAAYSIASAAI